MTITDKLLADKKWQELITSCEEILQSKNAKIDTYVKLAIGLRHVKKLSDSRKTLHEGLKIFPDHISLLIEMAALENDKKNWGTAVTLWEKIKSQTTNLSNLNYQRYCKAFVLKNEKGLLKTSENLKACIKELCIEDSKLKGFLTEALKIRLNEMRGIDKKLALQYAESISKFIEATALNKELAMSYMHTHKWNKAIHEFESILFQNSQIFDAYDYNRLLKCYEMENLHSNYEAFVLEGIRKFPDDQSLQFRFIYYSFYQNFTNKKYDLALQKVNLLLGAKRPTFWGLDKSHLLTYRDECIKNISQIIGANKSTPSLMIVANRSDGLGERINALLNAVVMAKTFNYKFGYVWRDQVHAHHLQKGANENKNLVGHAIVTEHEFFDPVFISNYSVTDKKLQGFRTITGKGLTYDSLYKAELENKLEGWFSPRLELKEHFSDELLINEFFSYKDAFSFIKFNKPITKSIELAKTAMKSEPFVALHLRSGDVFYGEYRKFLHYTYKGIVLPLAKSIIERFLKENKKVIVFGQDTIVLNYLKQEYNIITVEDFKGYKQLDDTQKAMFEITLMSGAENIIAGSSGFSKLASWIGEKPVESPISYYTSKKQTSIIRKDLLTNGDIYPKLQTSFAYWYAFFYGRHSKNISDSEYLLTQAYKYDPNNELYPLILSAMFYKSEMYERGESILKDLLSLNNTNEFDKNPTYAVLQAKTMGKPNLLEFIPYFKKTADLNYHYASIIMRMVEHDNNS